MRDFSVSILLVGVLRTLIWWAGAAFAYWRKRWLVCLGLFLAGCNAVPFTILTAGGNVPDSVLDASTIVATPIVAIIVASFVAAQPKRARRPDTWRP